MSVRFATRFALCAVGLAAVLDASAESLPRTGSIAFHTGWKLTGTFLNASDKHVIGIATVSGVTFNDKGSGPLHAGPANCFEADFIVGGEGRNKGFCVFGDMDGDRVFTEFTGTFNPQSGALGTNEITGGTGKYSGITGSGPWRCKASGTNSEFHCYQRLDYRLP